MSATETTVEIERDGALGRIWLNRPEVMNAITVELGTALTEALRELSADLEIAAIAIRGRGGNFCVGGDFDEVQRLREGGPDALMPLFDRFGAACALIGDIEVPVVAIVEGFAMAGGFELMAAVDISIVSSEAVMADNHVKYGQIPGGGGSQRFPRAVGLHRALGHMLTGDRLRGQEAVDWGLAYRCFPAETFDADVDDFLGALVSRRRDALCGIKSLIRRGAAMSLPDGLAAERDAVVAHIGGEAGASGVDAFARR